jgi:hypothetical protein
MEARGGSIAKAKRYRRYRDNGGTAVTMVGPIAKRGTLDIIEAMRRLWYSVCVKEVDEGGWVRHDSKQE